MGFKIQCVIFSALVVIAAADIDIGESKIVGGTQAPVGKYPHSVALFMKINGTFLINCGGSILSSRTVLTAAHCLLGYDDAETPVPMTDLLGRIGSNDRTKGGQIILFADSLTHPKHDDSTVVYDITLLFTVLPVVFTDLIKPIKMDYDYINGDVECVVAGWGRNKAGGPLRVNLQELQLVTVDGEKCKEELAEAAVKLNRDLPVVFPDVEICAVHPGNAVNQSICNGDSGGALINLKTGSLIGTVDWGALCANGYPDVYVRISAMKDWLQKHILP